MKLFREKMRDQKILHYSPLILLITCCCEFKVILRVKINLLPIVCNSYWKITVSVLNLGADTERYVPKRYVPKRYVPKRYVTQQYVSQMYITKWYVTKRYSVAQRYNFKTVRSHKTVHVTKQCVTKRYSCKTLHYKTVHGHYGLLRNRILQSQSAGLHQPMHWLGVKPNPT